jgi:hypothetical protein
VAELQGAMRRLLASAARRAMGATAYAHFRANFSEDVVVPRYLALVDRILSRRQPAPSMPAPAATRAAAV